MVRPIITLLTDFGPSGSYVGAMKGVILGISSEAAIVDISHDIEAQAAEEAAFLLATVVPVFPPGAIHVAVVDPGVGTERAALAVRTAEGTFVGPDNGVLSAALPDAARSAGPASEAAPVSLPAAVQAVRLTNRRYFRPEISNTFHGRDIFAPVAAHLSLGVPLDELGEPVAEMRTFPAWRATTDGSGCIAGRVLYIDRFGNVVTDVRASDLPAGRVVLEVAGRCFEGLQHSYQDGPEYVIYIGSSGYLELARRNGNAAATLGIARGQRVMVTPRRYG